jgi:hypothetical protein
MRIAISLIAVLSFSLGGAFGAVAQTSNAPKEHWQAVDKSMTDLLLEGYRPVSVIAPSPQRRIYFLSSGAFLAKCSEDATLTRPPPPPPPPTQMMPSSAQMVQPMQMQPVAPNVPPPPDYTPGVESTFTCSRLTKSN